MTEERLLQLLVNLQAPFARMIAMQVVKTLRDEQFVPQLPTAPNTVVGKLTIDHGGKRVLRDGVHIELTPREFAMLETLVVNRGRVLSREQLLAAAWPNAESLENDRTVDVHVRRLRIRLGTDARAIATVTGSGYRFDPPL